MPHAGRDVKGVTPLFTCMESGEVSVEEKNPFIFTVSVILVERS